MLSPSLKGPWVGMSIPVYPSALGPKVAVVL